MGLWHSEITSAKADKVTSVTAGNLATLDDDGNLVDSGIPNSVVYQDTGYSIGIKPTLSLDFENDEYKSYVPGSEFEEWSLNGTDSKITFTRASEATYFDPMGVMRTAATGEMRRDHDPDTGECFGLLVEESRTNLLTYSEQFDNAAWQLLSTGTGVLPTVSSSTETAPDGSNNAYTVTFNVGAGTTANDQSSLRQLVTIPIGLNYSFSLFLKGAAGGEQIIVRHAGNTAYTLLTLSNSWQRYDIVETGSITTSVYVTIGLRQAQVGIGTLNSTATIHIWGTQLEEGSFPTSYISTEASAVTRAADVPVMSGTDFSDWYNQSEGTVLVHFQRKLAAASTAVPGAYQILLDEDNYIECVGGYSNPAQQRFDVKSSGVVQVQLLLNSGITADVFYKIAGAYTADDFSGSFNGNAIVIDSSGSIPTVDRLYIGSRAGSSHLNGHIKKLQYYPSRLTDANLVTLSS